MSDVDALLLDEAGDRDIRAMDVLRRGIRRTPGVRRTMAYSAGLGVVVAAARIAVPVLVQQVIDRGLLGDQGYRPRLVAALCAATLAVVVLAAVLSPLAETAMVRAAQHGLFELRRQAFARIHGLSLAEHNRERRGVLLSRVTSDIETVSRFIEWGAVTWAVNVPVIVGAIVVMMVYSWQLASIAALCLAAIVPLLRVLQVRQLRAYTRVRTAVGAMLAVFNEVLSGSDTIRSYGYRDAARTRMRAAIHARYRANIATSRYGAPLFTVGDLVSTATMVVVALVAVNRSAEWGLGAGTVVLFFFLITLVQAPIGEITEVLDQTQTAVAGWNKVLTLLEQEPELAEPDQHEVVPVPAGPLSIEVTGLEARYDGEPVLRDVSVTIPAAARVAVVGHTGSGKTTFARLLVRLIDPAAGVIRLGGVDLASLSAQDRRDAVRLVPQDGFLFDTSVAQNIRYGRDGATGDDVAAALSSLGLTDWVATLPDGVETQVGPRGEFLSVGERQLVALARAQVADPGLLVLDEATSSVDPETEQALARALDAVASGRTTVTIAHRLSAAEKAELVLVFDRGRLVETGTHAELLAADGVYARLHRSWRRVTRRVS